MIHRAAPFAAVCALLVVSLACDSGDGNTPTEQRSPTPSPTVAALSPPAADPEVLVGAGDIADCKSDGDEATATLLDGIPGTVFTAGDNAYEDGSASQFAECYDPSWGRHRDRTKPAPGNHEYHSEDAVPYFNYFGDAAAEPGSGYYSYELGDWHIIVLNSNCDEIGGCGPDSPQAQWLATDLAVASNQCTLAYWHHPVLTIGPHEDDEAGVLPLWQLLYDAGADVVVNGHEHDYQRYLPLNRNAAEVDDFGMRLFIVGTGGRNLTNADDDRAASNPGLEVWADSPDDGDGHDAAFGVIKFSLSLGAYAWEFVPVAGGFFTDTGSDGCVGRASVPVQLEDS